MAAVGGEPPGDTSFGGGAGETTVALGAGETEVGLGVSGDTSVGGDPAQQSRNLTKWQDSQGTGSC